MKSKYSHLPLKAYEVYENEDDWRGLSKEYNHGVFVGRTAGQARAQVAAERMSGGATNPWPDLRTRRVLGLGAERAIEAHEDQGKYWRDTKAYSHLQTQADAFNTLYPVGTVVKVTGCDEASQWPGGLTITRTPAWVASLSSVLVSVEGQAGGMYLKYINPA